MILDAGTLMPAPAVETLVRGSQGASSGVLKTELHVGGRAQHQRQAGTGCSGRSARCAAAEIAEENDLVIAAAARIRSPGPRISSSFPSSASNSSSTRVSAIPPGRERPAHPRRDARSRGAVLDGFSAGSRSSSRSRRTRPTQVRRRAWRPIAPRFSAFCLVEARLRRSHPSRSGRS